MAPTPNEGGLAEVHERRQAGEARRQSANAGAGDPAAFKGTVDVALDKAVWVQWDNGDYKLRFGAEGAERNEGAAENGKVRLRSRKAMSA